MKDKMNKSIKVMLPFILILSFSCATTPKMQPSPPEELRADLGTVGIVSGSFQPEVRFQKPLTKGVAALHGAGAGAGFVARAGAGCNGIGCAGVIALLPVGAAVGSIVGAVKGVSPKKIRETEGELNGYLATLDFQETMRERFLLVAREHRGENC